MEENKGVTAIKTYLCRVARALEGMPRPCSSSPAQYFGRVGCALRRLQPKDIPRQRSTSRFKCLQHGISGYKGLKYESIGRRVRTVGGGKSGHWLWAADADWSLELDSDLGGGGRLVAVRLRGKLGAVGTSPSVLPSDPLRSLSSQSALPILFTARPFIECCSSPSPSQNACTEQLSSWSVAQVRIPLHAVTTN